MTKIARFAVTLVALLMAAPASAALTAVQGTGVQQGNPPSACSVSASVGVGQAVIIFFESNGALTGITVTSNVTSSNLSQLAAYPVSGTGTYQAIYWGITTSSGTPSITVTGTAGYTYDSCMAVTGFSGTPTADTAIVNTSTGTGTTATINATSNHNNEAMLVSQYTGDYATAPTVTGWTEAAPAVQPGYYAIEASSGTANNWVGTFGTSTTWYLLLAGVYDPGVAGCTHDGVTSAGAIAIPNGTSGSYRLTSGALGTPNCSTVSYKQTQGAVGVN